MAVSPGPTFSESWYRVSDLKPRLLGAVSVHRQYFRGRKWYVLRDPANNTYSRLSDAAYHFVAMLDGRRTVNAAWHVCMERFQDAAPTQAEAIHVLSQLHAANLLHGSLAPDARELFDRYRRRVRRELGGYLTNFLFIRFPLWDPDRFLDRWSGLVGRVFTGYGLILWCVLIGMGLWTAGENADGLTRQASGVLDPRNLPLLYLSLVAVKMIHELGHAFSCKQFGRREGTGGEVHQIGVTLLVFTPLPYVDASSAWALKNKWHRVVVGAGGMLAELAVAAVAAVIWARTAEGTNACKAQIRLPRGRDPAPFVPNSKAVRTSRLKVLQKPLFFHQCRCPGSFSRRHGAARP